MRMQVQPLAWLSGLRIRGSGIAVSCGVGQQLYLQCDPWFGNLYILQVQPPPPKKKKKKEKRKEKKKEKKRKMILVDSLNENYPYLQMTRYYT